MTNKIEHTGIVTHIDSKVVKVSIIQKAACSDCHAKSACTASETDEKVIDVVNNGYHVSVGEKVTLTGQSSMGFLAVLLAFIIPFILILISLLVLRSFTDNEAISGSIALAVLIPYYIILSLFNNKLKNKFQFQIDKYAGA